MTCGADPKMPAQITVEETAEDGRAVEARPAQPVDRAVA
jgi:hypothetical protein